MSERPPRTVEIGRQENRDGGIGLQVRVDGGEARRRSTVKTTEGEPTFTGRDTELRAIEAALEARRVVVLHGAPGLGKSRLATEYAHKHADAYPGGMFWVPFEQPPPIELAKLLRDAGGPYPEESVEDQCRRALCDIGAKRRALLIYDAIADERTLRDWLPYAGLDWHLIATSTSAGWASSWATVKIKALSPQDARALVAAILADAAASERLADQIAAKAAGVTIELCASAAAAHERLRRGRAVERVSEELARETSSSFEAAWALLSRNAQLALRVACAFATSQVPEPLLDSTLQRMGWSAPEVENAIDEARTRRLAGGVGNSVDVHQLVARFVRGRELLAEPIRRVLFEGLIVAAAVFLENPGNLAQRWLMLAHPLELDHWADLATDWSQGQVVGDAIAELGQFEAARGWFERAVAAQEKGDLHGRVDAARLGKSLHQVGYCCVSLGQVDAARGWFERAVAVKEKGDVHAAILAGSLHMVGVCYLRLGQVEAARGWFERAVAAAEQGDVHGRVDAASLGRSLHEVGSCYLRLGQVEAARGWFERAVAAKEKGDVYGRVDATSLGRSLHEVGSCYASLGQYEVARGWFERATTAAEKGDVHGRVNAASLGSSCHMVGDCYACLGQIEAAREWFERAVVAKEKGDVHGRVDAANLGVSLHMVGECYMNLGQIEAARGWFERAVAAQEKGDVHGRVNAASLGTSLHTVGQCFARLGQVEAARGWFERAVAAKEKGDVHGRVDAASLGSSLHMVGVCYLSLGQVVETALEWFERAVAAKEKGDVHGRVNSESLGRSLHEMGKCYARLDQVEAARGWFERAVAAKEKGDVHGRVDAMSLGSSVHEVGECHGILGEFEAARGWFERAVAAKEKGDVHGRVDAESLRPSLHELGACYALLGKFEAALAWFERAVAAAEQGDVHGRVDAESLGGCLHSMGTCYLSLGEFEAARGWFERAVAAKEKGDVHGRVNSESLGESLHAVGYCYTRLGQLEAARGWFECAAAAKNKGDVHGRADAESLGTSLQAAGLLVLGEHDAGVEPREQTLGTSVRGEYAPGVSNDAELGKLLETHKGELKQIAEAAGSGNQEKVIDGVSTLAVSLATGNPLLGLLAPLARKGIARAFGNSVNAALTRELAALEKEEERKKFLGQIDEVVEALIGQALIQLVRAQHNIKDEFLEALGGVRQDLEAFRNDFAERAASASESMSGERIVVREGGLGIRVRATTTKRVAFKHMEVVGAGSVGIDLE